MAQKTELPLETIENHHRLLADLHLNSISVSQLVIEAARQLDLSPPHSPTDYANATIQDLAAALEELGKNNSQIPQESIPMGVDNWLRAFTVELIEKPNSGLDPGETTALAISIAPRPFKFREMSVSISPRMGP